MPAETPWWYDLASRSVGWIGAIALVVIICITANSMAHAFAGKTTNVSLVTQVSLGISLAGVAATVVALLRARAHGRKVKRLDGRVRSLEAENEVLRRQQPLPIDVPPRGPIPER